MGVQHGYLLGSDDSDVLSYAGYGTGNTGGGCDRLFTGKETEGLTVIALTAPGGRDCNYEENKKETKYIIEPTGFQMNYLK